MAPERATDQEFVRNLNAILHNISKSIERIALNRQMADNDKLVEFYLELQKVSFQFKHQSANLDHREKFRAYPLEPDTR